MTSIEVEKTGKMPKTKLVKINGKPVAYVPTPKGGWNGRLLKSQRIIRNVTFKKFIRNILNLK